MNNLIVHSSAALPPSLRDVKLKCVNNTVTLEDGAFGVLFRVVENWYDYSLLQDASGSTMIVRWDNEHTKQSCEVMSASTPLADQLDRRHPTPTTPPPPRKAEKRSLAGEAASQ